MGMDAQSNRVERPDRVAALQGLALSLGVDPSREDLEAVLGFLDRILPELERLEGLLDPAEGPEQPGDASLRSDDGG